MGAPRVSSGALIYGRRSPASPHPWRRAHRRLRRDAATVRGRNGGAAATAPADAGGLFGGLTKTLSSRGLTLGGGGSKDPRTVCGRPR